MSLPNQNKNWPGTQTPSYSYDRNAKPQAPDCDLDSMHQFNDNESAASFGTDSYYEPSFDKWNNVVVNDDRGLHCEATAGTGQAGDRQFASNSNNIESTGYGKNLGLNVIEYDSSAAFNQPERVIVDVSRADRGKES
jgi:hypothetical protein